MQEIFISQLINQIYIIRYKLHEQDINLPFHYNSHNIYNVIKLYWSSLR